MAVHVVEHQVERDYSYQGKEQLHRRLVAHAAGNRGNRPAQQAGQGGGKQRQQQGAEEQNHHAAEGDAASFGSHGVAGRGQGHKGDQEIQEIQGAHPAGQNCRRRNGHGEQQLIVLCLKDRALGIEHGEHQGGDERHAGGDSIEHPGIAGCCQGGAQIAKQGADAVCRGNQQQDTKNNFRGEHADGGGFLGFGLTGKLVHQGKKPVFQQYLKHSLPPPSCRPPVRGRLPPGFRCP